MSKPNKKRGFVKIIVILVIALAGLKYFFDWSIFDALNSEQGRATVSYTKEVLKHLQAFALSAWEGFRSRI